jgi:hypothetical protein
LGLRGLHLHQLQNNWSEKVYKMDDDLTGM